MTKKPRKSNETQVKCPKPDVIEHLAHCLRQNKDKDADAKTAFLIGAGASKSAGMPLAREMVQDMAKIYPFDLSNLSKDDRGSYVKCMEALPTQARKSLISAYVKKAEISWGYLAMAALMEADYISRIFSFNFDNVLARACAALNLVPSIYDFAYSQSADTRFYLDPSIVHLHGPHYGKFLINDTAENEQIQPILHDMLREAFYGFDIHVIGYSGQEDVHYQSLTEHYDHENRLIWYGYDDSKPEGFKTLEEKGARFYPNVDFDLMMMALAKQLLGDRWPPKALVNPFIGTLATLKAMAGYPKPEGGQPMDLDQLIGNTLKKPAQAWADKEEIELCEQFASVDNVLTGQDLAQDSVESTSASSLVAKAFTFNDQAQFVKDKQAAKVLYEQAIELCEAALKMEPEDSIALSNLGVALYGLSRYEKDKLKAQALLKRSTESHEASLELEPENSTFLNNLGSALRDLAGHEKDETKIQALLKRSFELYEASLELEPENSILLNNLGSSLRDLAMHEKDKSQAQALLRKSIKSYEASLELEPENSIFLCNLGSALRDLAGHEKDKTKIQVLLKRSIEIHKSSLELDPENSIFLSNLGIALCELARHEKDKSKAQAFLKKSIESHEASLKFEPENSVSLNNLGSVLCDLARREEDKPQAQAFLKKSIKSYEASLKFEPENMIALYGLGAALNSLATYERDKPKAQALLKRSIESHEASLKLAPEDPAALNNFGAAYVDLLARDGCGADQEMNEERARGLLEKSIKIDPELAYPKYHLSRLYALKGRVDECLKLLREAAKESNYLTQQKLDEEICFEAIRENQAFLEFRASLSEN